MEIGGKFYRQLLVAFSEPKGTREIGNISGSERIKGDRKKRGVEFRE